MPSFKKSLIVEQFQGNYLKQGFEKDSSVTMALYPNIKPPFARCLHACMPGSFKSLQGKYSFRKESIGNIPV